MKLYVDLETLQLIEGPGFRNPISTLRFKRGDSARLEVAFLEGGVTSVSIGDPADLVIRFGVKPRNRYDVGYLVHSADWTMPAPEAESPVYLCSPSFNTVELDSALGVGSSTGSELAEITLMGEITWSEGTGDPTSTRTFLVTVENDVNRGTEGVPIDADPAYPSPGSILLKSEFDQRAVRYDAAQTPLNATQLGQFLDNLGRSASVLDLGSTGLVASAFHAADFHDPSGSYTLATFDGISDWSVYAATVNGVMGILDLNAGILANTYGITIIDLVSQNLRDAANNQVMVHWDGYGLNVNGDYYCYGSAGWSGSFYDQLGNEVQVSGGIITSGPMWMPE